MKTRSKRWHRRRAAFRTAKSEMKKMMQSRRGRGGLFQNMVRISMDTVLPKDTPNIMPRKYQDRSKYNSDGSGK